MRNKTKKIIAAICIPIFIVGIFFAGFFIGRIKDPDLAALEFIVKKYKAYYLETDENFVGIMANSILDAYSEYYTPEQYAELKKAAKGVRGGAGLSFVKSGDEVIVYDVLGNSPAEKAGVKKNSVVKGLKKSDSEEYVEVAGTSVVEDFFAQLELGEEFFIIADSNGVSEEYSLAREEYIETYVYYSDSSGCYRFESDEGGQMAFVKYSDGDNTLPSDTAYCIYKSFSGTEDGIYGSAGQLTEALKTFKENGKTKLILDLRNNGGGYMDIAEDVARHFVGVSNGAKPLISKAVYKDGKEDKFYAKSVTYSSYGFESITVLANAGTASASEVLIGAMLDYDAKGIVKVVLEGISSGENIIYRTYGKGIMQTTYPDVFGGGAIKLTTAKLYWPTSGITIHGVGVTKSVEKYGDRVYEPEILSGVDYALEFAKGF